MNGSYVPNKSFQGTLAYFNGNTESFTSTSDGDSESALNMTQLAVNYSGLPADHHTVTVTVDSTGRLSGHSSEGCTIAGTLSPHARGNIFHASMTLEGGACGTGTETLTGVAFYDIATQRLYIAALNNPRTNTYLFLGVNQ
jgi:hypothetical protein